MTVPSTESLLGPLLAAHQPEVRLHLDSQLRQKLADQFGLSKQDREERSPATPKLTTLGNRMAWASVYLAKAGLIHRFPDGGGTEITPRGEDVLAEDPEKIGIPYLARFPKFRKFLNPDGQSSR